MTLQIFTPEASEPLEVECPSGEQLRACMLDNKVGVAGLVRRRVVWTCVAARPRVWQPNSG